MDIIAAVVWTDKRFDKGTVKLRRAFVGCDKAGGACEQICDQVCVDFGFKCNVEQHPGAIAGGSTNLVRQKDAHFKDATRERSHAR